MPTTRRGAARHQQRDEHEGDVTLTEGTSSDANSVVEPAAAGNTPAQPSGFPLPTDQFLSTLLETITKAQVEANKALLSAFLNVPRGEQYSGAISPNGASAPLANDAAASLANGAFPPFTSVGSSLSSSSAGNFAKCSARFDGSSSDAEVLEAFLDGVEIYKECASVSDAHALRGLPMLLTGDAAVWWRGVRAGVATWTDAKLRLRSMYGAPRPAYKIFRDVFAREQGAAEASEKFLSEKRALMARLPYRLAEEVQVDMTYGLLDRRIRKRVPRESVLDMDHMLERVRMAEDSLKETSGGEVKPQQQASVNHSVKSHAKSAPAVAQNSLPANSVPNSDSSSSGPNPSRRPRCSFCRRFGHAATECRKREVSESTKPATNNNSSDHHSYESNRVIRCYGCGKIGTVRSRCDVCNADGRKTSDFNIAFIESRSRVRSDRRLGSDRYHADVQFDTIECTDVVSQLDVDKTVESNVNFEPDGPGSYPDRKSRYEMETSIAHACSAVAHKGAPHPLVNINVMGRCGVAIVDTGATHCIASPKLHKILVESGIHFREIVCRMRLADGSRVERKLLEAEVPVTLQGREVSADFLVLPGDETRTLLGVEFLSRAGMIVDVARGRWTFADEPGRPYGFAREYPVSSAPTAKLIRPRPETSLSWRDGDESKLTHEQRRTLKEFIDRRSAQFARKRPATEYATRHIKVSTNQEPIASPSYRSRQNRRDTLEKVQEAQNRYADKRRLPPEYHVGDLVLLKTQGQNDVGRGQSAKLIPRRDGPYRIQVVVNPTTFILESTQTNERVGKYHVSHLTPFVGPVEPPLRKKRRRGRPRRLIAEC